VIRLSLAKSNQGLKASYTNILAPWYKSIGEPRAGSPPFATLSPSPRRLRTQTGTFALLRYTLWSFRTHSAQTGTPVLWGSFILNPKITS